MACLILKMAQIRSQRKKIFFLAFFWSAEILPKNWARAVWMFILPTVHPFLCVNLSYDTSPEREIHNLED